MNRRNFSTGLAAAAGAVGGPARAAAPDGDLYTGRVQMIDSPSLEGGGGNLYFAIDKSSKRFVIPAGAQGGQQLTDLLFFAAQMDWRITVETGQIYDTDLFQAARITIVRRVA